MAYGDELGNKQHTRRVVSERLCANPLPPQE